MGWRVATWRTYKFWLVRVAARRCHTLKTIIRSSLSLSLFALSLSTSSFLLNSDLFIECKCRVLISRSAISRSQPFRNDVVHIFNQRKMSCN